MTKLTEKYAEMLAKSREARGIKPSQPKKARK